MCAARQAPTSSMPHFDLPPDQSTPLAHCRRCEPGQRGGCGLRHSLRQIERRDRSADRGRYRRRARPNLVRYVAAADGLQTDGSRKLTTAHHFANVLFNIMRGGIFADGYQVERDDLLDFVGVRNRAVLAEHADWFEASAGSALYPGLYARAADSGVPDLIRLCL